MNHLTVNANFEPGGIAVREFGHDSERLWVALTFNWLAEPSLSLYLDHLGQLDELDAALAQAREFLTDEAARDAA